jgi:hypothetical protein
MPRRESFQRDLARLSFNGTVVTGGLGLISIDLAKAQMMVRCKRSDPKPFGCIDLSAMTSSDQWWAVLSTVMEHPKLKGCDLSIIDDIMTTLYAYISIRLEETPVIRMSPEAARLFEEILMSPEAPGLSRETDPLIKALWEQSFARGGFKVFDLGGTELSDRPYP